jgi:hypothetical protein
MDMKPFPRNKRLLLTASIHVRLAMGCPILVKTGEFSDP